MQAQVQVQAAENVAIALVHHPVLGKNREIIGSAVTNLDLHDIARIARTYGVGSYFIVTPYSDQQELVRQIIGHWQEGHGSSYNPARKEAFSLVRLADSLDEVRQHLTGKYGQPATLVTTSAVGQNKCLSFSESKKRISGGEPTLIVFGTAHGLAPEVSDAADYTLPAIRGRTDYNHLSVRSAAAIICDRLLGERIE